MSISASARVKRVSWNTVSRWRARAAEAARGFNDRRTCGYEIGELQADEIRTFVHNKAHSVWVFASMEVGSRLWPSTVLGRRSYRNTRQLLRDTAARGWFERFPLIWTDGFQYYRAVVARLFGPVCVLGQVIKTWRKNRVTRVERKQVPGSPEQLEKALGRSEDSARLNTAFIERLNLTIRQGTACLCRRTHR